MVRLWALVVPVLVLLAAVPLLRRSGAGADEEEKLMIASARAVATRGSLVLAIEPKAAFPFSLAPASTVVVSQQAEERIYQGTDFVTRPASAPGHQSVVRPRDMRQLDGVIRADDRLYAKQPPVFSIWLGMVAWGLERAGVSFERNPEPFAGLLTFFAVTLPVALAAGLVYRMARVFELPRPGRVGLALACAFACGWFASAAALGPQGPAAAALVGATALVIHLGASKRPRYAALWMPIAGLAVGISAAFQPVAALFFLLFPLAILCMRHPVRLRLTAVLLLGLGSALPVTTHVIASQALAGDVRFPWISTTSPRAPFVISTWPDESDDIGLRSEKSAWLAVGQFVNRLFGATLAPSGWVGRFPALVMGMAGVVLVLRRHWAASLKLLAGGALGGATITLIATASATPQTAAALSAGVFMPILLFWAGAWLRRPHRTAGWVTALVLVAFSVIMTFVTALWPAGRGGGAERETPVVTARR